MNLFKIVLIYIPMVFGYIFEIIILRLFLQNLRILRKRKEYLKTKNEIISAIQKLAREGRQKRTK